MLNLDICVVIPTKNESQNIAHCINSVIKFAARVIVVDSDSVDGTQQIAKDLGAEVLQFPGVNEGTKKRQWLMNSGVIKNQWTFLLDADEQVPVGLWHELGKEIYSAEKKGDRVCFFIKKQFHFMHKRFRFGGFSFMALLVFPTGMAEFEKLESISLFDQLDMEVHERLICDLPKLVLSNEIIHDDYKGLERYVGRHNFYSSWDAMFRLSHKHLGDNLIKANFFGDVQERRRFLKRIADSMPFEPMLWFLYHYVFMLGFLEGRKGLYACVIRAFYISLIRMKKYELRCNADTAK